MKKKKWQRKGIENKTDNGEEMKRKKKRKAKSNENISMKMAYENERK